MLGDGSEIPPSPPDFTPQHQQVWLLISSGVLVHFVNSVSRFDGRCARVLRHPRVAREDGPSRRCHSACTAGTSSRRFYSRLSTPQSRYVGVCRQDFGSQNVRACGCVRKRAFKKEDINGVVFAFSFDGWFSPTESVVRRSVDSFDAIVRKRRAMMQTPPPLATPVQVRF